MDCNTSFPIRFVNRSVSIECCFDERPRFSSGWQSPVSSIIRREAGSEGNKYRIWQDDVVLARYKAVVDNNTNLLLHH